MYAIYFLHLTNMTGLAMIFCNLVELFSNIQIMINIYKKSIMCYIP